MKLYLDDVRMPSYTYSTPEDWHIVRTYEEFCSTIQNQAPTVISFDHDLGDNVPSGMDCAKWLVEYALDGHIDLTRIEFLVHSDNPPGASNIRGLLSSYLSHARNQR